MPFIQSHLEAVNKLILGHPLKIPAIMYGPYSSGKSILFYQLAYDFLRSRNVFFMDTEGGLYEMMTLWKPVFDKRFNIETRISKDLSKRYDKGCVYLIEARHIRTVLREHGYDVELEITGGKKSEESVPKINLRIKGLTENRILKLIRENNVGYIVYDSISAPLRTGFVGGRTQLPARSDACSLWLSGILELADDYDVIIYSTAHESYDPANPYATPHIRGPTALLYSFKIVLYLDPSRSQKNELKNRKTIWLQRFFNVEGWSKSAKVELTSEGYRDIAE